MIATKQVSRQWPAKNYHGLRRAFFRAHSRPW